MEKLIKNINEPLIIIPTAGLGTRLGELGKKINKSLISFFNKPILSHIIDQSPKNSKFIIPVGYKSQQVIDFVNLIYPNKNISFVVIDDYVSDKSGTAYTFLKCVNDINQPFWYIPCDTFFNENIFNLSLSEDTIFVKQTNKNLHDQYTTFLIDDNKIKDKEFKKSTSDLYLTFTGVMYIQDYEKFIYSIKSNNSREIIDGIKVGSSVKDLNTWIDLGNINYYKNELSRIQKYDFTKTDEITYICNNKVIKWFNDESIARKKIEKIKNKNSIVPNNCSYKNNFLSYDFFNGTTLYANHSTDILYKLLEWLKNNLWLIDHTQNIDVACEDFYKQKTLSRINKFFEKYPKLEKIDSINNVDVKNWKYYFDSIDWNFLIFNNLPSFIHGDLQFDNIVYNDFEFKIIDWRHEFASSIDIGDLYYDLSKLLGGFIIDYSQIKENNFSLEIKNNAVYLQIPFIKNSEIYTNIVKKFILKNNWNLKKVELLIPIIFWNMAPLHSYPFDKFLWFLGIKLFEEYEKIYKHQ